MIFAKIDIFFCLIIFLFAIIASVHGIINELLGKLAFVGALGASVFFYRHLAVQLSDKINSHKIAVLVSFLSIFITVFLAVKIIQCLLLKLFKADILKSLDHSLGFLFGIAEGCIAVAALIVLMNGQPLVRFDSLLENSFFMRIFTPFVSSPTDTVRGILSNVR